MSAARAKLPPISLPAPLGRLPFNTDEAIQNIESMRERINGYIQFMSQVGSLKGTSAEAKEKAVAAFHERMIVLERQLGRIHDDLREG
jgi:hypothetical protein